jgi:hypothetical protein
MLRMVPLGLAALLAGATGTSSAAMQAASSSTRCELHIWPTDKFAVTENLGGANLGLVGALIDEATRLKSPEDVREQLATQLNPTAQEETIRNLNLNVLLSLPDYKVVIEPADSQPRWTLEQIKSSTRLSKAAPACYAELVIVSQQYLKQAIGTRLRTFVRYREFGPDGVLRSKLLDTTSTEAKEFPAKNSDGIPASATSVQNAFRNNLIKLAKGKLKR